MSDFGHSRKRKRSDHEPRHQVKRSITRQAPLSRNESVVLHHYNQRHEQGTQQRKQSDIYHLRALNNWIKSILFRKYVRHGDTVLDFCAGKGGDLQKWQRSKIKELFFVDHAISLIQLGIARYNNMIDSHFDNYNRMFPCTFMSADCFDHKLDEVLPENVFFDVVSSQFAVHYAFESEERVRAMLYNVSCRLKQGGYFIGTTPDADRLVRRWRNTPPGAGTHEFGNGLYQVRFVPNTPKQQNKELDPEDPFGIKYYFNLADAIDQCPEFLLHMPTFQKLATEYGLELVMHMDFHQFFVYEFDKPENRKLLNRMKVLNENKTIPEKEWEIASLYLVFAFRKTTKQETKERDPPKSKKITEEDVIVLV